MRAAIAALVMTVMGGTAVAQTAAKPIPPAQPSAQSLPAQAAPPAAASNGGGGATWESRCTAESRRGQQDCLIQQMVPIPNTQLFMTVVIRPGADRPEPAVSIEVPLGVLLQPGLALRLDDGRTQWLSYLYCIDRGCHAGADLNPDMVKAFNLSSRVTAALQTLDNRSFAVPIATAGFAAAFDKIK